MSQPSDLVLACKLTSAELRERKATVITELKNKIVDRGETENGFKYKFDGSGNTIDQLITFIKTERVCCPFFIFNLSVTDEKDFVWLEVTGKKNVKEFIRTELGV